MRNGRLYALLIAAMCIVGCREGEKLEGNPLPERPSQWVSSIPIAPDSNPRYIGKTTEYLITASTPVAKPLTPTPANIAVGETYEGLKIGAIKCDFMTQNGSYNGEQLLWRGNGHAWPAE